MWFPQSRPRPPELSQEKLYELELFGREVLLIARATAEGERVELRRQWVTREELDAWIVWKDAETTWWQGLAALAAAKAHGVKLGNPRPLAGSPDQARVAAAAKSAKATARATDLLPVIAEVRAAGVAR